MGLPAHGDPLILFATPTVYAQRVTAPWAQDIAMLSCPWRRRQVIRTDYSVAHNREKLAEVALEIGASHVLWLDDDIRPRADALILAMSHGYPLVSGHYRGKGGASVVVDLHEVEGQAWPGNTRLEPPAPGKTGWADATGFGFLLMDTRILRRLPRPWFCYEEQFSEDYFFCWAVKRHLGIRVLVDGSIAPGHEMTLQMMSGGETKPLYWQEAV